MNQKEKILTLPNLLSVLRLLLIPVIVWLYRREAHSWALAVLVMSGLTDIVDGYIARRFHLISDVGKILDPVADKLTQLAVLLCLVDRFPYMLLLLGLMVVKELLGGILNLRAVRLSGKIRGADWHGKVNTVLLYTVMALHILLPRMPETLSKGLVLLCAGMMVLSGVLYCLRARRQIREACHG